MTQKKIQGREPQASPREARLGLWEPTRGGPPRGMGDCGAGGRGWDSIMASRGRTFVAEGIAPGGEKQEELMQKWVTGGRGAGSPHPPAPEPGAVLPQTTGGLQLVLVGHLGVPTDCGEAGCGTVGTPDPEGSLQDPSPLGLDTLRRPSQTLVFQLQKPSRPLILSSRYKRCLQKKSRRHTRRASEEMPPGHHGWDTAHHGGSPWREDHSSQGWPW